MKKPVIYIENSVFGFYYDDKLENRNKMQATRILFTQINQGLFTAFTSQITTKELSAAPPSIKNKLLALITDHNIEIANVEENEIEYLVKKYMDEKQSQKVLGRF